MKFSANLGFLWADRPLRDAVRAAKDAGFDAVECHWPYETPAKALRATLEETGLPLLGLNTVRGDVAGGENGLAALPGREAEARAAIDQAVAYASQTGASNIHVMAGFASGPDARATFLENLDYACSTALASNMTILIEPLNRHDAPGYFLGTTDQARGIITELGASNLKLMFDCYHVGRNEGDLITRLADLLPIIGHIQFAAVPDRGPPDHGEIAFEAVFKAIQDLGWTAPLGAEYKPKESTDLSLAWMNRLRDV